MSNSISIKAKFGEMRTVAFGNVSGAYTAIGNRLEEPARIVIINNASDKGVLISQDGTTDALFIGAGDKIVLDLSANKSNRVAIFAFSADDRFYIKEADGALTSGSIYFSFIYGA